MTYQFKIKLLIDLDGILLARRYAISPNYPNTQYLLPNTKQKMRKGWKRYVASMRLLMELRQLTAGPQGRLSCLSEVGVP